MNNYLVTGSDVEGRAIEVEKIIEKVGFRDATTSIYDLEYNDLSDVLEDLDTYGLFSDKKIIILKNIELFNIKDNEDKYKHLIKYLNNSSSDKLFIIECDKLSSGELSKELKKLCINIEVDINTKNYIKECLKGYSISQDTINLLDEYCLGDIIKIKNECNKLKLYKIDEKKIDVDDVKLLVQKKLGDSKDLVFAFANSIASKDKSLALKKYIELLDYNVPPVTIIGLVGGQLRIIYQVKLLDKKGLSNKEIGDILGEKEYRIKKTREVINNYSDKDCLELMKKLSNLDLRTKSIDTDVNREIELFIMNL